MFQDIMQELVPEGDGHFNLGEVLLFAFTIVLAVFTAFRSYDFIKHTLPPGWELVAYVGLAVLDGGFLIWALVIALSATSPVQIAIAWGMWLLDALGLALVTIADTFFYIQAADQTAAMAQTVSAIAAWAFPILAVVNAAFAILYKVMPPTVSGIADAARNFMSCGILPSWASCRPKWNSCRRPSPAASPTSA